VSFTKSFLILPAVLAAIAEASAAEPASLRVRALGCFFEVPASYTLIADPGESIQLIAPYARGSISIEPVSSDLGRLSETSSRTEGHLTVRELTDHDPRGPVHLTNIQNELQRVVLWRAARELAGQIIESCLANVHPRAPGAP
jgi:hypothetical protein